MFYREGPTNDQYGFLSFPGKYKKQLMDIGLHSLKTASKKVVYKAGENLENKIADAVNKSNDDKTVKQVPVEKIIIPPENGDEIYFKNWEKYYKNRTL